MVNWAVVSFAKAVKGSLEMVFKSNEEAYQNRCKNNFCEAYFYSSGRII